jgi:hypothetical protein
MAFFAGSVADRCKRLFHIYLTFQQARKGGYVDQDGYHIALNQVVPA